MHQQVGLAHLVECRFERVNEVGGQFADKSHGIGQQERQVLHHHLAHRGVESGEEFVLGEHLAFCQQVHHSRFPHVGISHESHADESSAVLSLCGFLLVNFHESLLQQGYALQNYTAVHLQLSLSRSAQSYASLAASRARATALTLEVGPQSLQSWQHIAVLRQFHLRLGVSRLRPHGEDVENQRSAVENLHLQFLLDVAYLLCREFVVENHHAHRLWNVRVLWCL